MREFQRVDHLLDLQVAHAEVTERGPFLLDLNILTALLWPAHEHHPTAHRWFSDRANVEQVFFVTSWLRNQFYPARRTGETAGPLLRVVLRHDIGRNHPLKGVVQVVAVEQPGARIVCMSDEVVPFATVYAHRIPVKRNLQRP